MAYLENIISDANVELQRLIQGDETTRYANSIKKDKRNSRNIYKEKYINGILNSMEYLNNMASTIGSANYSPEMAQHEDSSDGFSDEELTIDEKENICHICLLPMKDNFAHHVYAGFCKGCAEGLMEIKVKCPICRANIKGILKDVQ